MSTRSLTTLAMLTAIAYLVMILSKMLPQVSGFLQLDLKDTVISGSGMSVEDAKADFLTAYKEVLDSYTENGEAVPDELKDLAFEYKYDVSAFFNQFDCINASKFAALAGISPSLMRHYKSGDQYISEKQLEKIERAAHELGRRLLAISM